MSDSAPAATPPPRDIEADALRETVARLIRHAASHLPQDYLDALRQAQDDEVSPLGQAAIEMLLENARYAEESGLPTCQDTGMAVLHLAIGQNARVVGGDLHAALAAGVRDGYEGLRKSVVGDPVERVNTRDNTPPLTHVEIVPGDRITLTVLMKGFGAELMSALRMMPPSAGIEGVRGFVLETLEKAGPNACPPVIVGVGLGGSFDRVALLAKKALLRPLTQRHPEAHIRSLEEAWLHDVNALGVGPQGLGGKVTALAVNIETAPTHIAALPVAVNLNCSAPRRATAEL